MKNLFLLVICVLLSNVVSAQQIVENQVPMSQGNKNAFMVDIPNVEAKDVEKSWTKFLKKYDVKTKKAKKSDEFLSDNAKIEAMSSNTVDIYSKVIQKGTDCQLVVWYDLGGAYVKSNTHPDAYAAAKEMLDEFTLATRISVVKEKLKEEESKLKKLNKEKEGLVKDKEGYEDDIEKYKRKIQEAKEKIKQNLTDQEKKTVEIKTQGVEVEKVTKKLKRLEQKK